MMSTPEKRLCFSPWAAWIYVLVVPLLASCHARPPAVLLSLVGYNYTGRYISNYSVNGESGLSLWHDSDGGGSVCCLSFRPDSKLPFTVTVKWRLEDIRDLEHDRWTPAEPEDHEAIIEVKGPIPEDPGYFETHFLPDGSIKVYITRLFSDAYYTPEGKPLRPMP